MLRRNVLQASCAAALASIGFRAAAQSYPTGPIRIVTPYDPGSAVDITSRMVAEGLSKRLGQPVIVENRPGGQGAVGMNALLGAPANGYTLLTDTPASAINPSLYKSHQSRYNATKDLAPVAQLTSLPFAIAVDPSVPAKTVGELVKLLKDKPGSLNAAVAGTSTRLAGEQRLRPIIMTSLAFAIGVLPLAIAVGAGANARHSIGTGIIGGMLGETTLAMLYVPLFFYIFDRLGERGKAKAEAKAKKKAAGVAAAAEQDGA